MATATLVSEDIEIGRRIVAALTRANIPVTVYLWAFVPDLQEWQLMIATPLVDSKGPLAVYNEVNKVLHREPLFDKVTVFLRSPNDRELKALQKESRTAPQESFRAVNEEIAGRFVEEAYLYAGSIHIVPLGNTRGGAPETYSVIYAPYSGPGGAAPSRKFDGIQNLKAFLMTELSIDRSSVESALTELSGGGSASIPNVQLRPHELRRLRLA
ncbi:MAG TPA: hypothetical protein VF753_08220 [Terriglobales bacterium]